MLILLGLVCALFGGLKIEHSDIMWSAICCTAPHSQAWLDQALHLHMLELKHLTPVRNLISFTHAFQGRSKPRQPVAGAMMYLCNGDEADCHSCDHLFAMAFVSVGWMDKARSLLLGAKECRDLSRGCFCSLLMA